MKVTASFGIHLVALFKVRRYVSTDQCMHRNLHEAYTHKYPKTLSLQHSWASFTWRQHTHTHSINRPTHDKTNKHMYTWKREGARTSVDSKNVGRNDEDEGDRKKNEVFK